jgi:hypothetical protein
MTTTPDNGNVTQITDAPSAAKTTGEPGPAKLTEAVNKPGRKPSASKPSTARKPSTSKPKTTAKPKAAKPKPTRAPKPEIPAGYTAPYGHRTYVLIKTDPAEGESKIAVMCRAHGTIYGKPVKSITEADAIAAKPNRPTWCRKCKAEQAAKADASK